MSEAEREARPKHEERAAKNPARRRVPGKHKHEDREQDHREIEVLTRTEPGDHGQAEQRDQAGPVSALTEDPDPDGKEQERVNVKCGSV